MTDTDNTYDNLDISIRSKIDEGRERFNACTMRWVAFQLNVSPDVVRHRLQKMQNDGLVDWNDMAGSLTVTEAGRAEAPGEPASEPKVPAEPTPPAATTSKKRAAPKKKAAKKKAAAKKQAASSKPPRRTSRS